MLNIVGMAMAFAALYVIMVQVNFDLGYNKKVKDSDRIYAISMPDWYTPGNWQTTLSRPLCENVINNVSCVECGGTASIGKGYYSEKFFLQEDGNSSFYLNVSQSSLGAFKVFSVEAVEGSIDNIVPWKDLVISDTKAEKLGLHVGDVIYSHNHGATMQQHNIAAIYKHFPANTDLSEIECFVNMGDLNIDLFSEWSYPYFVKLNSADDIEPFEKQAFDYVVKTFNNMANEHGEELSEEDRKEAESRLKIKLFPFDEMYFEKTISSAGRSGSKTTTYTLLAIAILVIVIAFINFINFFFALVPVRLKSVNTRKILGASRSNLVFGIVVESVVMIIVALALAAGIVKLFCGSTIAALIPCSTLISNNIAIAFGTALGGIVLAIVSSLYPALYITAFPPAFALKGSFGTA